MAEKIELDNNLSVTVESESNGIETKYKLIFIDGNNNQSGTISIAVNNFESGDFDDCTALDIAAQKCSKSFDDLLLNLKKKSEKENYENISKFLPIAIIEFRNMQKKKSFPG